MRSSQVKRLAHMRDATGEYLRRLAGSAEGLRRYVRGRGYEEIDTPLLEETELFVRKSGGELIGRLYTFTDPGGHRVSLRPEFTSSVIRHYIQVGEKRALPLRWQYDGPVFRYGPVGESALRQFTQSGAELIGAGGVEADAEVISIARGGLETIGLGDANVRIGHLGVLRELLSGFELSEPAKLFVVGNVHALKYGDTDVPTLMEQATMVGLLKGGGGPTTDHGTVDIGEGSTSRFIEEVLSGTMSSPVGRREPQQIVRRLLRKAHESNSRESLRGGLEAIRELSRIEGSPATMLARARGIARSHGLRSSALDELGDLFERLREGDGEGSGLVLDLGLARGIGYYTGVIFEMYHQGPSATTTLGGGGRYDGLVKSLGGPDVPALGFAYTLEEIVDALDGGRPEASGLSAASAS